MASINRYKTDDGQKKYLARITLKGFKRMGKSFDTKEDAWEWADRVEAELNEVELAAQLGHSTLQMVKRYSHLRGGHRGAAHEKLDKALGG
jgi:hypothetical protein